MNGDHGDMAATQDCDPAFPLVLQQSQFLRESVYSGEGWQVKGTAQGLPNSCEVKLAVVSHRVETDRELGTIG